MSETWGEISKRVISKVIEENPDVNYQTFKFLLRQAYPFGERKYFPYKAWCKQQKHTLNTLFPNRDGRMQRQPIEGLFAPGSLIAIQDKFQAKIDSVYER